VTTVAFTAITSVCLLALVQPFVWKPVAREDILLFAIYAACSGFGELLVIKALEISQAVVVAPLQYTMIFWTTGYGYLIFGNLPDMFTIIGAGIIVASGLYTLRRTKARVPRVGPF
jgi:S-adenosylmethionine uptake transporter